MKMNPQSNLAGFIDESSNRPGCSAVAGLAVRQLYIYIYILVRSERVFEVFEVFENTLFENTLCS